MMTKPFLFLSCALLVLSWGWAQSRANEPELPKELKNSLGMKLNLIPAGEFEMGSPVGEKRRSDNELQHRVQITKAFYMQTTEVTQKQYADVMSSTPWAGKKWVKEGPNYAASYISWNAAVEFCRKLSEKESHPYRLPTEAEWEYACRAGTKTAYTFGDHWAGPPGSGKMLLDEYAWWGGGAVGNKSMAGEEYPHQVAQKRANAWGLLDMPGNVSEWCSDQWIEDYYRVSPVKDPQGPERGTARVLRGGAWNSFPTFCGSAARDANPPEQHGWDSGFRVVAEGVAAKAKN